MPSQRSFALVVLIVCGVNANSGKCPSEPPARQNLDLSRYMGTWYLQMTAKAWDSESDNSNRDCISESYSTKPENPFLLDIYWRGRVNGEWISSAGLITLATDPSKWNLYMDGAVFHATTVATDYTNWTIEYACVELNGAIHENYMIRSRSTSLSTDTLNTLKSILEGFGMDPKDFVTVTHVNC